MAFETIYRVKGTGNFFESDFTPEESNKIIKNLVEKIEKYEKAREMKTKYDRYINSQVEERITAAKMESKDGVVKGVISYASPSDSRKIWKIFSPAGFITARFNFNSQDEADKKEYLGLVKIIKGM